MVITINNLQAISALLVGVFVFINPKLAVRLIGAYLIFKGLIDLGLINI